MHDANARNVLGGRSQIEAIAPVEAAHEPSHDTPSVHGLDRSNWGATTTVVPVDGTLHGPTYTRQRLYDRQPARRLGLYPTAQTALDLDDPGSGLLRGSEVAAQFPRALVEVGLMPIRAIVSPPWVRRQSPMYLYKRQPPGGWLTGGPGSTPQDVGEGGAPPPDSGVEAVVPAAPVETIQGDEAAP